MYFPWDCSQEGTGCASFLHVFKTCFVTCREAAGEGLYRAGGWGAGRWKSGLSLWHDHHPSCRVEFQARVTSQKEGAGRPSLSLLLVALFFLFTENSRVLLSLLPLPDPMFLEGNAIHGRRPWKTGEPVHHLNPASPTTMGSMSASFQLNFQTIRMKVPIF